MRLTFTSLNLVVATAFLVGCGTATTPSGPSAAAPAAAAVDSKLLLAAQPADAQPVIDARKAAKDGEEITVVGRIGGDVDPWVKGRAAFLIVDPSLVPCSERAGDSCPTPWDYCCDTDQLPAAKATIKFVDDQGQTLPTDARELLGLKELQTVTVRGQAKRDEAGNLTILATGIYIQP